MIEENQLKVIAFFHHGSSDSRDRDILYLVEGEILDRKASQKFILMAPKGEDRNVFCISRDNIVCDVYRGLPDEVHNQLLATYALHPQKYNLPVMISFVSSRLNQVFSMVFRSLNLR